MSTKIFDGQIIHMSIGELYPYALQAAEAMRQTMLEITKRRIAIETLCLTDTLRAGFALAKKQEQLLVSRFGSEWDLMNPQTIAEVLIFAPPQDDLLSKFSLCLFPYKKDTLALLFADRKLRASWDDLKDKEGKPLVHDFGYWDNSDEPEDMTRKEWKARGRIWDEVLRMEDPNANGTPSHSALMMVGEPTLPIMYASEVALLQQDSTVNNVRLYSLQSYLEVAGRNKQEGFDLQKKLEHTTQDLLKSCRELKAK